MSLGIAAYWTGLLFLCNYKRVYSFSDDPTRMSRIQRRALSSLLLFAFVLAVWVVSPLWIGMLLGTVMAFSTEPMCQQIAFRIGHRTHLAAGIMTIGCGLLTTVLGSLFVYVFTHELLTVGGLLQQALETGSLRTILGDKIARFIEQKHLEKNLIQSLETQITTVSSYAAALTSALAERIASAIATLIVALFTMYFVLLDWASWIVRLERILPLHPYHTQALVHELQEMGKGAFLGALGVSFIQGMLSCVGYFLGDVPHPVTWGLATAVASFLPLVGTTLVWGSIGLYLLLIGHPIAALFVWGWGLFVVTSLTEYVLRPLLIQSKGSTHPLLTLLSLLGGIEILGIAGIIVGPMLMSLWLAVLHIYERDANFLNGTFEER